MRRLRANRSGKSGDAKEWERQGRGMGERREVEREGREGMERSGSGGEECYLGRYMEVMFTG